MNITTNVSSLSGKDTQTAKYMIELKNTPIIAENTRRAALVPPQAALPLLPSGTAPEIKASYEAVLAGILVSAHASYMVQEALALGPNKAEFRAAFETATPAQRTAALAALTA